MKTINVLGAGLAAVLLAGVSVRYAGASPTPQAATKEDARYPDSPRMVRAYKARVNRHLDELAKRLDSLAQGKTSGTQATEATAQQNVSRVRDDARQLRQDINAFQDKPERPWRDAKRDFDHRLASLERAYHDAERQLRS